MAVSIAADAVRAHELGGLTEADIAVATGATEAIVRGWLTGRLAPAGEPAQRLHELATQVERLAGMIKRDAIAPWMRRSVPRLGGATPLDVFAAGGWRRIAEFISGLEDPPAV
jgi:hypothetical protein